MKSRQLRKVKEALEIVEALGFPKTQRNERSALTLLALLNQRPISVWAGAEAPLRGITPLMEFMAENYGKSYAPNTRETVRRQTMHQFVAAGLVVQNPDDPKRPVNSPKAVYQVVEKALTLLRSFGTATWEENLRIYLGEAGSLADRYAQQRDMLRIPVTLPDGTALTLSPGGQNPLVRAVVEEFCPRYAPGGRLLHLGDTDEKLTFLDEQAFADLGIRIDSHGKLPDVVVYRTDRNWLILIEAVTSHGPIHAQRRDELAKLFAESKAGLVFVTAFLTRKSMLKYLAALSWETEVWVADSPDHLIHLNGERFLGPYTAAKLRQI